MKSLIDLKRGSFLIFTVFLGLTGLQGCSDEPVASDLKEAWDEQNDPEIFGYDYLTETYNYSTSFEELPLDGDVVPRPWSGDYWPTYKGGISYRWHQPTPELERYSYEIEPFAELDAGKIKYLSPAEKYDLYIGAGHYPLTRYERRRTQILKTVPDHESYDPDFSIPTWEGLCHAWAPATLHYDNPKSVTLKGKKGHEIPFGSSDIKALLTMAIHLGPSGNVDFLGQRCNTKFSELEEKLRSEDLSEEEVVRAKNAANCRDTNAGAFHLVLTNEVGLDSKGFIVDITRDFEVWNQPVEGYESVIVSRQEGAHDGAAPETVEEVEIETTLFYTTEIHHSYDKVVTPYSTQSAMYRYRLELDENGDIIGGEWLSDDRPDFLWRQEVTEFSGFFGDLKKIYEKSTAPVEPTKPSEPSDQETF